MFLSSVLAPPYLNVMGRFWFLLIKVNLIVYEGLGKEEKIEAEGKKKTMDERIQINKNKRKDTGE